MAEGVMSECRQCGGRMEPTGKLRDRAPDGFGPPAMRGIRSAEYMCAICGAREWAEVGETPDKP